MFRPDPLHPRRSCRGVRASREKKKRKHGEKRRARRDGEESEVCALVVAAERVGERARPLLRLERARVFAEPIDVLLLRRELPRDGARPRAAPVDGRVEPRDRAGGRGDVAVAARPPVRLKVFILSRNEGSRLVSMDS